MARRLVILGGGGHARVVVDALRRRGEEISGIADPALLGTSVETLPVLGDDEWVSSLDPTEVVLVNGIGSVARPLRRRAVFERFAGMGFRFGAVVHPAATVAADTRLAAGTQVLAGAILQPGVTIGANAIVNAGAIVEHDATIHDHVHVAPGSTLCGNVSVGEGSFVGAGATVIQGRRIGACCLVAAGALVLADVPSGMAAIGHPARLVPVGED